VTSRTVFHASAAVLALHAAADAFLAPEQGTAWHDHLVPALASLAVIALAVGLLVEKWTRGRRLRASTSTGCRSVPAAVPFA
jgi:hypothetical protein